MPEKTVQKNTIIGAIDFANDFFNEVQSAIKKIDRESIANAAELIYRAGVEGRRIFFFGNGGSYSIATHMAADLGKGTKTASDSTVKYKAISLDNAAWVSAQANDGEKYFLDSGLPGVYEHGYDGVFVGQLENFIEAGDIVFAISSSGNSRNVVNGLLFARSKKAFTIAMVGFDGGECAKIADNVILVETLNGKYGVVEAVHEVVHHYIYEYLKQLAYQ